MSKTKIEWCDWTINPVKGLCPMACSYCYARRMYKRFKWDVAIRYDPTVFMTLPTKPSRIFVGSTMELFGPWNLWQDEIIDLCERTPEHTFIFLTKCPQTLPREWPDNCWVGCSVTSNAAMTQAMTNLVNVKARTRFISFEPLLGDIGMNDHMSMKNIIDWVIVGQQTPVKASTTPRIEWVKSVVKAANKAGAAIFLKDNLAPLFYGPDKPHMTNEKNWYGDCLCLRQEYPIGISHV